MIYLLLLVAFSGYIFYLTGFSDYPIIGMSEGDRMPNTYRGRLVSKNQMTIPVLMQQELEMVQGDELEFVVDSGRVSSVYVLKPVRVELLPDKILESLKQRTASGSSGRVVSHRELTELSKGKELEIGEPTPRRAAVGD